MTSTTTSQVISTTPLNDNRPVRYWLYAICALIFAMVVVGGATRLTDSGLSITEWKPILGIIPPLDHADWQDAFQKYKQIPEYHQVNKGMSLEEFKYIFWWEWGHRFLGRMIGFAFFIPFVIFLTMGMINRPLIPRLFGLFVLGGLQGALGWYMVKSGLVDRIDVSQYRLAAHLGLAFLIFAAVFWVALGLKERKGTAFDNSAVMIVAVTITALLFLQVILGAFVAGTKAGLTFNTWPLMDGAFIPNGLFLMEPWHANLFENVLTVQFNHRMLAYGLLVLAALHVAQLWRSGAPATLKTSGIVVLCAIIAQAALGIWTLLTMVPINLGIAHQGAALLVFATAIYHLRALCDFRAV